MSKYQSSWTAGNGGTKYKNVKQPLGTRTAGNGFSFFPEKVLK